MEQPTQDTAVLAKKTRQDRKHELQGMLSISDGMAFLTHLYRFYFPSREGSALPSVTVMITRILSMEYPGE